MANNPAFVHKTQQTGVQMREMYDQARSVVAEYNALGGASAFTDDDIAAANGTPFTKTEWISYIATLQAFISLYEAGHLTNIVKVAA